MCATTANAKAATYLTRRQNALLVPRWGRPGTVAWMNPPFCQLALWAARAWEESQKGVTVVGVLPGDRMEQPWWSEFVCRAAEVRCIEGRVKFVPPPGVAPSSPRFGCVIVIWRPDSEGPPVMTPFGKV